MKLDKAIEEIKKVIGIPFKTLYKIEELEGIKIAKGNTGKLLEKIIGLPPGNTLRDFEDGELKTNKCNALGKPLETMFISQLSSRFDDLLNDVKFEDSWIYEKIDKLLYVPVVKTSENPDDWYFLNYKLVNIEKDSELYNQLAEDFEIIKKKINADILINDGFIHTSSGKYIQIRTKDAKPYNPIFSKKLNRFVSNKNFAFYFQKNFMIDIQSKID
ncbi:MAG: MutH/Sau3AI family endonuclease [Pyrinomonadaceae bacterium]